MSDFESMVENLNQLLGSNNQSWLFGAGISCDANIPLMKPLTERVKAIINVTDPVNDKNKEIYESLASDLEAEAHVEHYLSHLGDLIALAERAQKDKGVSINGSNFNQQELRSLHSAIVEAIGITVRYGYKTNGADEVIGSLDKPIVDIDSHINFLKALFRTRVNLTSRSNITFFTINYDTLLEDAMALEKIMVVDGFSGGAMGFWNPIKEFNTELSNPNQYHFYKLHGSVDWHKNDEFGLIRARYGTKYLSDLSEVMIYPQATKYVETQKDPFANLFAQFRLALNSTERLITCGYSFGDEHINAEIEAALSLSSNLTLIAFAKELPRDADNIKINKTLDSWLLNPKFGKRVLVAGEDGLYHKSLTPFNRDTTEKLNWWKFSGLTEFLNNNGEL